MSWEEIIAKMHVEPSALKWAERATWPGWSWLSTVVFIALSMGLIWIVRTWLMEAKHQSETVTSDCSSQRSEPNALPIDQLWSLVRFRAITMSWVVSLVAAWVLIWVWRYTRNPASLLRDLGVSSVWELSPMGITTLLGYLQTLAWIQILLAGAGFAWLLVTVGFWIKGYDETDTQRGEYATTQPLPPEEIPTPPPVTPPPEPEPSPKSPVSGPPDQSVPDIQREPATIQPPLLEEIPTPLLVTPPPEPEPSPKPEEKKPLFFLRLRSTDPSFYPGGIYLNGVLWRVGEYRDFRSVRLYVSPDGRHIRTRKRKGWLVLRYESDERCLRGYSPEKITETAEIRFDVSTGQPSPAAWKAVYDGEHFYVAKTRFQFLINISSESNENI